ncbi:MAG: AbrB/MazE/SpoVT family DNA-binding domain-containing protein [Magnetococcales bacterium]|nr:AbrB/MazE/SpoVT family DNA-binding domain-containing protein [Magnetococcales bacterium]
MASIRVTRRFQVTIPARVREAIPVGIGDMLEAKAEEGRIVFTPVAVVSKRATGRLDALFARIPDRPHEEEKIMEDVRVELKEWRAERRGKRGS